MQTKNINAERAPVNNNNNNVTSPEIVFACLATLAYSAPAAVEVTQDTVGNYKFIYKTDDATRVEVRHADGHVYGSIKYYDPEGHLRTLEYTSGPEGYHATGPLVPTPVKDTHEVAVARSNHLNVFNAIDRYLPRLNPHGLVDETPEVPLSKEEFLASVSAVLHGGHLAFTADTPEVSHAKIEHYKAVSDALGH